MLQAIGAEIYHKNHHYSSNIGILNTFICQMKRHFVNRVFVLQLNEHSITNPVHIFCTLYEIILAYTAYINIFVML